MTDTIADDEQELAAPARRSSSSEPRRSRRWRPTLARTGLLLAFFGVWELASRAEWVNPVFLPPPTRILAATADIIDDPAVATAFAVTGSAVLTAFLIALAAGMVVGLALGLVKSLREAFLGPILFLLSTPKSVFLPIFLLVFGLGIDSKIAFGAFSAFFYIVTNIVGGVGMLQDNHKRLARAFNAPLVMYLRDIVVPSALPGIFVALWFGLRQAITGVLIAELFAASAGVGFLIRIYTNQFRTDRTLAMVMMLSILAILGGSMWDRLERRLNRWRDEAHTG